MRRLLLVLLSICLLLCLAACSRGEEPPTWQTQYDLGMRYLSEGNYEEAVIAFCAAIEIDPRQPEAYISLAEAYIASEDYDRAAEAIAQGQQACGEHEGFERLLGEIAAARGGEDSEIELNSYDIESFEDRWGYCAFSDMTPEQQQVIEAAGNAAITGDMSVLYGFLETYPTEAVPNNYTLTIWNGYKMNFCFSPYSAYYDGAQQGSVIVEMRPENGVGYVCDVRHEYVVSTEGRDNWTEYWYSETFSTCLCVNWQWNGTEEYTEQSRMLSRSRGGDFSEIVAEITEIGTVNDNLRDGVFTRTSHSVSHSNLWEDEDQTVTSTSTYQAGVLIEENVLPYKETVGRFSWDEPLDLLYW